MAFFGDVAREDRETILGLRDDVSALVEALAQTKGGVRCLAEELEADGDPKAIARQLHEGCDAASKVLLRYSA